MLLRTPVVRSAFFSHGGGAGTRRQRKARRDEAPAGGSAGLRGRGTGRGTGRTVSAIPSIHARSSWSPSTGAVSQLVSRRTPHSARRRASTLSPTAGEGAFFAPPEGRHVVRGWIGRIVRKAGFYRGTPHPRPLSRKLRGRGVTRAQRSTPATTSLANGTLLSRRAPVADGRRAGDAAGSPAARSARRRTSCGCCGEFTSSPSALRTSATLPRCTILQNPP